MPKPMLNLGNNEIEISNLLSENVNKKSSTKLDKLSLDRLLIRKRSKEYIEAVSKLDAGGNEFSEQEAKKIIDVIEKEFDEISISSILLGFVSICYLGEPYEVHVLDITGNIVKHYESGKELPNGLEKARSIAIYGGYSFIEVYTDCLRAVSENGDVFVISAI